MGNVVVIGSQWGDEGKGKIVDWLCERADIVVRFQGGHNAGHTLVVGESCYKLNLLPSGIVRGGKLSIIGNGVVFDPHAFIAEIDRLQNQGLVIDHKTLRIADNACLILSLHRELDEVRESASQADKIGTTKRGIGPAYEDKVARRAIRVADLAKLDTLPQKIARLLSHHNALRAGLGLEAVKSEQLYKELAALADRITPFTDQVWRVLAAAKSQGKQFLFEGAQGVMLDIDHGTYPFVTSSNTLAGAAASGAGLGPDGLGFVLGVTKAYTTRVGEGPFPTEQKGEIGEFLGVNGHEFGTVTGRKRRCGWFDAVLVRQAVQVAGITGIALTKLDVLDKLAEIKICVGYQLHDQAIDYLPAAQDDQQKLRPVYETLPGWQKPTKGAQRLVDLPHEMVRYIQRIEDLIGVRAVLLSTSPEREHTILVQNPFQPSILS